MARFSQLRLALLALLLFSTPASALTTVYRVMRQDEVMANGIQAKNPTAQYTVAGHLTHGSRAGFKSQYISTTASLAVAQRWAAGHQKIAAIDLSKVKLKVVDLTTEGKRKKHNLGKMGAAWAHKSQEVLIAGAIPASAMREVPNPPLPVLAPGTLDAKEAIFRIEREADHRLYQKLKVPTQVRWRVDLLFKVKRGPLMQKQAFTAKANGWAAQGSIDERGQVTIDALAQTATTKRP